MKIRRARFDDITPMINFMRKYHGTSNLAHIPFIKEDAVKVLDHFISHRDCHPIVAVDNAGEITGLLTVALEPYFFNKKYWYATDLQFISKGAGMQLLAEFKRWAKTMGVEAIVMGVSSGDPRADSFLELSGMEKTGSMYVLRFSSS